MVKALAFFILLAATLLFWGVGVTLQRLMRVKPLIGPVAIGLGISAVIFVGGLLNLARIAFAPVLWSIAAIALLITLRELRHVKLDSQIALPAKIDLLAAAALIGAVALFVIGTQLPPSVFNFHDDFEKYFSHPVRMLSTGTLSAGPLSSLGSETLGGESLLQAFILSIAPIGYINGADAIFGLFVMTLLGASAGWRKFGWFPGATLGVLLITAIDPQYVNVSALYLGGILMGTAAMVVAEDREQVGPPAFLLGLVYAGVIALKSTFGLFVVCHLPLCLLALHSEMQSWTKSLKWAGEVAVWTLVGLAPWLAMYVPEYLTRGTLAGALIPPGFEGTLNLLSFHRMFYGTGPGAYTLLGLLATGFALLAALSQKPYANVERASSRTWKLFAGAFAGLLSYVLLSFTLAPVLTGYDASLRLSIPFVMGGCSLALLMAPGTIQKLPRAVSLTAPLVGTLAVCALFVPSVLWRYKESRQSGSILAFSPIEQNSGYLPYNAYVLSGPGREYVRAFQDKVPAHKPLLVWINAPFLLDFKRNAILDVDTGVGTPWAHIPANMHYVLWQYTGEGVRGTNDYAQQMQGPGFQMRVIATRALTLGGMMSRLAASSKIIASDNQMVLFELSANSQK
jgi:hypothetical protein